MAKRMVGFDIGQREVKMVYTVDGQIKKAVSAPLPDNMVAEGVILSMDAMADFLRESAKANKIPLTNAAVILPEGLVFARNAKLPMMTPGQLKFNLPYEFKDYLTLEKDKYFYDYAIYQKTQPEQPEQEAPEVPAKPVREEMELFACAVLKSTIADYRAMFKRAGFKLKVAVPEEWAFVSLARAAGVQEETVCFVDLGHGKTQVHVVADGRSASKRSIPMGIHSVEECIAEDCHVDIHTARAYKESDYEGALCRESCCKLYDKLSVEVLKTVNFYNYSHRDVAVQAVCLCGGGAAIEPLVESIKHVTNLEIASPMTLMPQLEGQEVYLKAYGCAVSR